jgi:hypothetical protein
VPVQCAMPVPLPDAGVGQDPRFLSGLGVLTSYVTAELAAGAVETAGVREKRVRRLPAVTGMFVVLGMCLMSGMDSMAPPGYRSVLRSLTHLARQQPGAAVAVPTRQAVTKARQRLGVKPFELLFDRVRGPRADRGTPGAYVFGRRLAAWDGTCLEAPGTPANRAAFGAASGGGGPQIRLLALIECGTRAVIDAAFGGYHASELGLARELLASLRPGMLLLADKLFPGYDLWGLAAATRADLLWRLPDNRKLTVTRELPDGSYLSVMPTPAESRRLAQDRFYGRPARVPDGHLIRVIPFTITITSRGGRPRTERYRLVTTLLDYQEAPAGQLAALYRQRWESENGYGELKTRLHGAGFTLRSRTPDLARQEMLALLITWQALTSLRTAAAAQAGIDPDQVSFTVTLRIARDHAIAWQGPATLTAATRNAITSILSDLLEPRRDRQYKRERKPRKKAFPDKKPGQPRPPAKTTYQLTITPPAQTP